MDRGFQALLDKTARDRDHYKERAEHWQGQTRYFENCYENAMTAFLASLLLNVGQLLLRLYW